MKQNEYVSTMWEICNVDKDLSCGFFMGEMDNKKK